MVRFLMHPNEIMGWNDFFKGSFERSMKDLIEEFFQPVRDNSDKFINKLTSGAKYPKLNVYYKKKCDCNKNGRCSDCGVESLIIEASVPGLTKDDVILKMEEEILLIKYDKWTTKTEEDSKKNKNYLLREIKQSSWMRMIPLNKEVHDLNSIEASCKNGILTISIDLIKPLVEKEEKKEERVIQIK